MERREARRIRFMNDLSFEEFPIRSLNCNLLFDDFLVGNWKSINSKLSPGKWRTSSKSHQFKYCKLKANNMKYNYILRKFSIILSSHRIVQSEEVRWGMHTAPLTSLNLINDIGDMQTCWAQTARVCLTESTIHFHNPHHQIFNRFPGFFIIFPQNEMI